MPKNIEQAIDGLAIAWAVNETGSMDRSVIDGSMKYYIEGLELTQKEQDRFQNKYNTLKLKYDQAPGENID